MTHDVPYLEIPPPLDGRWNSACWAAAPPLEVAQFHAQSSDHRPRVQGKLLHSGGALHVLFQVQDRYVRAACTRYGQKVCRDSCVEIFCSGARTPATAAFPAPPELQGDDVRGWGKSHNWTPTGFATTPPRACENISASTLRKSCSATKCWR